MSDKFISTPRPLYEESEKKSNKKKEVLHAGSKTSGVVITVTKEGIEIDGYYAGFSEKSPVYGNLRVPVYIAWDELEKVKTRLSKKRRWKKNEPDHFDDTPDQDYLDTLPIVHINGSKYYIDGERRERRSVVTPRQVYKF